MEMEDQLNQEQEMVSVSHIELKNSIIEVIKTIYDPEIPVDIYELGLIYEVEVDPGNNVNIQMTLTAPNCPAAESLPAEVQQKVQSIPGVASFNLDLVFDPPWTMDYMSEEAKLELGML